MKKLIPAILVLSLSWQLSQAQGSSRIISDLKVEASTQEKLSSYFGFQTTRAAWFKICGGKDSYCGEPTGLAFAGPLLIVIVPGVLIADLVVGIGTVPYDLLAAPLRTRKTLQVTTWKISAKAVDSTGTALPNLDLKVVVGLTSGASTRLGGATKVRTDSSGLFSAAISASTQEGEGLELFIKPSRMEPGNPRLRTERCPDARVVCF